MFMAQQRIFIDKSALHQRWGEATASNWDRYLAEAQIIQERIAIQVGNYDKIWNEHVAREEETQRKYSELMTEKDNELEKIDAERYGKDTKAMELRRRESARQNLRLVPSDKKDHLGKFTDRGELLTVIIKVERGHANEDPEKAFWHESDWCQRVRYQSVDMQNGGGSMWIRYFKVGLVISYGTFRNI